MAGSAPHSFLLFAEVLLIWHTTNYLLRADPFRDQPPKRAGRQLACLLLRSVSAAILTAAAAGLWPGSALAAWVLLGCLCLPLARWRWVPTRYLAELEVLSNAGFSAAAWFLIEGLAMDGRWGMFPLPPKPGIAACYLIAASLLAFTGRGGTFIVRGVLARAGTVKP